MKTSRIVISSLFGAALAVAGALVIAVGCSSEESPRGGFVEPPPEGGGGPDGSFNTDDATVCDLKCRQAKCADGKKTTVSGTVFDPGGHLPLYNVAVFVPQDPLAPLAHGAACERCGTVASGRPLVSTLTDSKGRFVLEDVPTGADVPLVIQVGKWRRQLTLPNVEACKDNPIENQDLTRLPKNQKEGELPQIAMVTGCDAMECLLRNMGIDDAEFTNPSGPGRVHLYQAVKGGTIDTQTPEAGTFWGDLDQLKKYDMVILACECAVYPSSKPPATRDAMRDYVNAGGRLFLSHYHYFWLRDGGPDLASTAEWQTENAPLRGSEYVVDETFPKGEALAEWLVTVGASKTKGRINLGATPPDINGVDEKTSQRWIYDPADGGFEASTKYYTFNTPVGSAPGSECGRVVFTDLHVSSNNAGEVFPAGCTKKELSIEEKALEFLIYDLSACVQNDDLPPNAPK